MGEKKRFRTIILKYCCTAHLRKALLSKVASSFVLTIEKTNPLCKKSISNFTFNISLFVPPIFYLLLIGKICFIKTIQN